MYSLPNLISYYCSSFVELVGWVTSFGYLRHSVNDSYDEILGEHVSNINFKLMDER